MKNFVKLIQQVHEERFSVVVSSILSRKIPVAFLSTSSNAQSIASIKDFQAQGLNITTLFSFDDNFPDDLNFEVININ